MAKLMESFTRTLRVFVTLAFSCCANTAIGEASTPEIRPLSRDVTFIVTSDCHYDAFENEDRNDRNRDTIRDRIPRGVSHCGMNAITNVSWPEQLVGYHVGYPTVGGGLIQRPRGVLVLGDAIDDGDRIFQGKHQTPRQWLLFQADFGLDGTDGLLNYPVYETWGNHDGPPVGKEQHGFTFQAQLKQRNLLRQQIGYHVGYPTVEGWLTNLSTNGLHYSWDWDDVHFVQLGIYPADRQHPEVKYSAEWHDPQGALAFLKHDLAEHMGASARPVVLMSHCGFDTDWWHSDDWKAAYEAMKPYNVILYLYGHSGTGLRQWMPPGEDKLLSCVNTGQTENGFFVVRITDNKVRLAFRIKHWLYEEAAEGKPRRTWDGTWEWKHLFERNLIMHDRSKPAGRLTSTSAQESRAQLEPRPPLAHAAAESRAPEGEAAPTEQ